MVRSLERRVARLEAAAGGASGCPECGGPDDPDDHTTYEIVFVEEAEEEWCPECGRQISVAIYFDDDPRAPWNRSPEV